MAVETTLKFHDLLDIFLKLATQHFDIFQKMTNHQNLTGFFYVKKQDVHFNGEQ